jgi:cation diffusion facilitator family transporter
MATAPNPYHESRKAAVLGLVVSLGLGGIKLLGGVLGNSLALLSDAIHSLVDASISAALLLALALAERPADRERPYGHGRVEAVAGAGVALILLALAAAIAYESLSTIAYRHSPPAEFTLLIAGGGAFFQELLYRYVSRVARRTGSTALLATAWDYRLDALGGIGVLVGVALTKWAGWLWADHVAAVLVAVTVLWIGGGLLWENVQSLIDHQADPEILGRVREEARAVPGVLGVEKLRVRRMGIELSLIFTLKSMERPRLAAGTTLPTPSKGVSSTAFRRSATCWFMSSRSAGRLTREQRTHNALPIRAAGAIAVSRSPPRAVSTTVINKDRPASDGKRAEAPLRSVPGSDITRATRRLSGHAAATKQHRNQDG